MPIAVDIIRQPGLHRRGRGLVKISSAQIKVAIHRGGKKEPADLARVVKILKDADYRGYLVLEYEEQDPHGEIPGYLRKLRELIHA